MDPVVVFPDVAAIVRRYLREQLDERGMADVAVKGKVPNPRPAKLVKVRRLGGVRLNLVADDAQIGLEHWAEKSEDAHDLAQLCRGLLFALRGTSQHGVAISRVAEFAGPQELPDPESSQPRYVHTVQIVARGQAEAAGS